MFAAEDHAHGCSRSPHKEQTKENTGSTWPKNLPHKLEFKTIDFERY